MRRRLYLGNALMGLLIAASALPQPAKADNAKLTDFIGVWNGSGTDRDAPFASFAPIQCQTRVTADPSHMTSDMYCDTKTGVRKHMVLAVTLAGNQFTGTAEQTAIAPDRSVKKYAGSVSGTRDGDTTKLVVHFSGLTPNAHIVIAVTPPNAFTMQTSALGSTLSTVEFRRAAQR